MPNETGRPPQDDPAPGRWLWAVVLALAVIAFTPLAHAQILERPRADLPVALVADNVTVEAETGRVIAEGSVEVYYGDRTLTARRITYDDQTGQITAEGEITLRDSSGVTVYADAAELDADLKDGLVLGARSVMGEHTRLAAAEARRVDGRYNTLSKAVYSPCKVCDADPTPLWRIRARRVIHDEKERIIHYENATFDVLGVPIAWLPYFRHPDPTVDRASGFLVPEFSSSSVYGYGIKQPYYWVIDDQSDLTLTPFFMTNDRLIMELEYRRAFGNGDLTFGGSATVNNYNGNDRLHGHVDTHGLFALTAEIDWGWDITVTSDDAYLNRFDLGYLDRLSSEVFLRRYRTDGYFDVAGVYFQSLRDNEPAGQIPMATPVFDAEFNFDDPWLDGKFSVSASSYALRRNEGRNTARSSLGIEWERQEILPVGLAVTAFAQARADLFSYSNDAVMNDDTVGRVTGMAGIEASFPLISDNLAGVTHVIEPVIQAIAAPHGGNDSDIPIEDSLVTEFDETNVIERNHFSGLDNIEEGPRLNIVVHYERMDDEGFQFNASAGRVFRFRRADAFSSGSGLQGSESDYVAAWQASYDPFFTVRHRVRISDDVEVTRNELFGDMSFDRYRLSLGYVFYESDPAVGAVEDREEIDGRLKMGLDDNWSVNGFLQRDLQAGEFVEFGGGISYVNECCSVDLMVRRQATSSENSPASTSVGLQIRLLTLGTGKEK